MPQTDITDHATASHVRDAATGEAVHGTDLVYGTGVVRRSSGVLTVGVIGDITLGEESQSTVYSLYPETDFKFRLGSTSRRMLELHTTGLQRVTADVTSGPYTLDTEDGSIHCDATSGAFTVNLPTASGISGRQYTVTKVDAGGNAVTLDGNGSETINGATTHALSSQWDTVTVESDDSNWIIIAS